MLFYVCFYFVFPFSFKSLQTTLIIKQLIKHEYKFNRKVFPEAATGGVLSEKVFLEMRKIHRKTSVPESLF